MPTRKATTTQFYCKGDLTNYKNCHAALDTFCVSGLLLELKEAAEFSGVANCSSKSLDKFNNTDRPQSNCETLQKS